MKNIALIALSCILSSSAISQIMPTGKDRKVVIVRRNGDSTIVINSDSLLAKIMVDLQKYEDEFKKVMDSMDDIMIVLPQEDGMASMPIDTTNYTFEIDEEIEVNSPRRIGTMHSSSIYLGAANVRDANFNQPNGFPELSSGKSLHVGLSKQMGFNLIKGKLRMWAGLQYDINNLRFSNNNTRLVANGDFTYNNDSSGTYNKSKVVVNYLAIPLAIGYQSNGYDEEDGFWIKAGITAGYKVRTHSKIKTSNGEKKKTFDDYGFAQFAVGPFIEGGYNSIGFYARYGILPVFETNNPSGNMLQFGIVLK